MTNMFNGAVTNKDISKWIVSHIVDMSGMFYNASSFNQPLKDWTFNSNINLNNFLSAKLPQSTYLIYLNLYIIREMILVVEVQQ